jgi:hypothetical protein
LQALVEGVHRRHRLRDGILFVRVLLAANASRDVHPPTLLAKQGAQDRQDGDRHGRAYLTLARTWFAGID